MLATPRSTPAAGPEAIPGSAYNDGFAYGEEIGARGAGRPLVAHLASRYPHSSPAEWARRVGDGEVEIDGVRAAVTAVLQSGQRVVWHRPPWREELVPLDFAVLHADADLLAVAKPRGLPTMPAGGFLLHTLFTVVRRRYADATPAHRLGRGTSGIVLFALSPLARRRLPAAWNAGAVVRRYRALAGGCLETASLAIDTPIGMVPHARLGRVHAACDGGRQARSTVRTLRAGDDATLVEVAIATGRPHQIRIHLAAVGHPLVGDPLYGPGGVPRADGGAALPGDGGYWLHADRIELPHPRTDGRTVVECLPPPPLRS